ncbi:MAG TPA: SsrA-binding protein SmpB, partial [Armatimonadota bacterium]|nr:SsrA-binding protein SmpB [Armatimonadota bacterium]
MEKEAKKVIVTNRKAWHEYTIDETYDAGIVLVGTEVKSIRAGKVNLQDSFCRIENGEVWVHGMYIAPYEFANRWVVDPRRSRKLLLHRDEID